MKGRGRCAALAGMAVTMAALAVAGSRSAEAGPPVAATAAVAVAPRFDPPPPTLLALLPTANTISGTINGTPIPRLAGASAGCVAPAVMNSMTSSTLSGPPPCPAGAPATFVLHRPFSSADSSWTQWAAATSARSTVVLMASKRATVNGAPGTNVMNTTFTNCSPVKLTVVAADGGPPVESLTFAFETATTAITSSTP